MSTNHHTPHNTGDALNASVLNTVYSDLDTAITANATAIAGASGTVVPGTVQGRLTLSSTLAVTAADVTGATTLYLLPYQGNLAALYDGTSDWEYHSIPGAGVSASIPATTDTNYDVYLYDASGTLTLDLTAWTNDTTRATALATQDGALVKTGATTRLYIGTIRTTGVSGECEDSAAFRYVWNAYNQKRRALEYFVATDSWTYATAATWRQWNNDTANRVSFVAGLTECPVEATSVLMALSVATVAIRSGLGINSTTTPSGLIPQYTSDGPMLELVATWNGYARAGYNYIAGLERIQSASTVTFSGDNGDSGNFQSGITGAIWA